MIAQLSFFGWLKQKKLTQNLLFQIEFQPIHYYVSLAFLQKRLQKIHLGSTHV